MKKAAILLMVALTFMGCSREHREMEEALHFRSALLQAQGCSFQTEITADYGEVLYEFSMDCRADRHGTVSFSVTGPETIAGITGTVSETKGELTFDDTALQFELMAEGTLSPVSAPWLLIRTLRSGCITSVCEEGGMLRLSVDDSYADDALRLDIWLDEENRVTRAEVLQQGVRILTLRVASFQLL